MAAVFERCDKQSPSPASLQPPALVFCACPAQRTCQADMDIRTRSFGSRKLALPAPQSEVMCTCGRADVFPQKHAILTCGYLLREKSVCNVLIGRVLNVVQIARKSLLLRRAWTNPEPGRLVWRVIRAQEKTMMVSNGPTGRRLLLSGRKEKSRRRRASKVTTRLHQERILHDNFNGVVLLYHAPRQYP